MFLNIFNLSKKIVGVANKYIGYNKFSNIPKLGNFKSYMIIGTTSSALLFSNFNRFTSFSPNPPKYQPPHHIDNFDIYVKEVDKYNAQYDAQLLEYYDSYIFNYIKNNINQIDIMIEEKIQNGGFMTTKQIGGYITKICLYYPMIPGHTSKKMKKVSEDLSKFEKKIVIDGKRLGEKYKNFFFKLNSNSDVLNEPYINLEIRFRD